MSSPYDDVIMRNEDSVATDFSLRAGVPLPGQDTTPIARRRELDALVEESETSRVAGLRAEFSDAFEVIRRNAISADREGRLQHEGVDALVASGFTRLRVPESAGGTEIPLADLFALLTDLGAADPGVANAVRGHFTFIEILRLRPDIPDEIRTHWFKEIAAGRLFGNAQTAAPGSPPTTATAGEDGSWTVTGKKYYSSGSLYSDYIRVSAEDERGEPVWAIVPTGQDAVDRRPDWGGFGQRTSASGSTEFSAAAVDPLGIIPIDKGVTHQSSFVQIYHLATLAGIVREVLDESVTTTTERPPKKESFSDFALDVVGDLYIAYLTAQSLVRTVAGTLEEANRLFLGTRERRPYELLSVYTLANQVSVIEQALHATTRLFDVGGAGLTSHSRDLDRHWRNARTIASHNPVAVKRRLLGDFLVTGRFYGSPFQPFDADGAPREPESPGEPKAASAGE